MLKYTVSLYTSIPFGLKALYRNIIIPQNENERERNTDIRCKTLKRTLAECT